MTEDALSPNIISIMISVKVVNSEPVLTKNQGCVGSVE